MWSFKISKTPDGDTVKKIVWIGEQAAAPLNKKAKPKAKKAKPKAEKAETKQEEMDSEAGCHEIE